MENYIIFFPKPKESIKAIPIETIITYKPF